jgi:hypothetical protein
MNVETNMSQRNVERVIGRLVTDEAFRRQFAADPHSTLSLVADSGVELNDCELRALASIDPEALGRFTAVIDPRIQKSDLGIRNGEMDMRNREDQGGCQ